MRFEKVRKECFARDSEKNDFYTDYDYVYSRIELPERKTSGSAGYDFSTPYTFDIQPGEKVLVPTGIKAVDMPKNVGLMLYIRSSIGIKQGIVFSNGTGVIDSDYANNESNDGDIHLALHNTSRRPVVFRAGDRIAQGVFVRYETVDNDNVSSERTGGIGSTDN